MILVVIHHMMQKHYTQLESPDPFDKDHQVIDDF